MFFQNQPALILEKFLPSVYSKNYYKKTEKEQGEGRLLKPWLSFCFNFERSSYFYLADLFMRHKKEGCSGTFLLNWIWASRKTIRDALVKIRTDPTSTLIVKHSFCDWCCCLKGFPFLISFHSHLFYTTWSLLSWPRE